jgi:hypothetical protein
MLLAKESNSESLFMRRFKIVVVLIIRIISEGVLGISTCHLHKGHGLLPGSRDSPSAELLDKVILALPGELFGSELALLADLGVLVVATFSRDGCEPGDASVVVFAAVKNRKFLDGQVVVVAVLWVGKGIGTFGEDEELGRHLEALAVVPVGVLGVGAVAAPRLDFLAHIQCVGKWLGVKKYIVSMSKSRKKVL